MLRAVPVPHVSPIAAVLGTCHSQRAPLPQSYWVKYLFPQLLLHLLLQLTAQNRMKLKALFFVFQQYFLSRAYAMAGNVWIA